MGCVCVCDDVGISPSGGKKEAELDAVKGDREEEVGFSSSRGLWGCLEKQVNKYVWGWLHKR